MFVRPTDPSSTIRDPHTGRVLPAEGGEVPEDNFWVRRLRDGSVVLVEEVRPPTGAEPVTPLTTRGQR
jgi:hypothetical protein